MTFNLSSRIIINIVLPYLDSFFQLNFNYAEYAVSPVMKFDQSNFNYKFLCSISLTKGKNAFNLIIYSDELTDIERKKLINHIQDNLYYIKLVVNLIFKSDLRVELITQEDDESLFLNFKRIDISFMSDNRYLTLLLPPDFLNLFSHETKNLTVESIENEIVDFFKNPVNLFPDLKNILESLNDLEIQKLFYQLQNKNLLTPYQISLMLMAFPQYTVRVKQNLSANIVSDVNKILKKFDINKRDLAAGVYSIEEAIYMLLKKNEDFQ